MNRLWERNVIEILIFQHNFDVLLSYEIQILSDETGKLLQRLSDINDGLNEWANSGVGPSSVAGQHTLQRHRDILQVRNIFMLSYEKIEI